MKRIFAVFLSLVFILTGCTVRTDNSFAEDASIKNSSRIDKESAVSENSQAAEISSSPEHSAMDSSMDNTDENSDISDISVELSVPETAEESSEHSVRIPDPPEGSILYVFPGDEVYYREEFIFDYEGGKAEFEKYYKLVNDHWEELPMSDYEQTISVPHLAEQEIRLSCWIVLDGNKLIRAKNRDNAWRWVLDPLLGGSWLRLNDFRYCILWDEDTQQFIDVFKNIDLSMNERGYDLWAHTADMTKALFQGYSNEKLVPRYYADLTTNTVYDLETIGGESPQVVMLSGEDVIVISGLEEKEYLSKKEFAVYHSYYKDTSVQEIEMGEGHVLRLWHIGVESIRVYYQEDPDSRRSFSPLIAAGAEMIDLSVMPDDQD